MTREKQIITYEQVKVPVSEIALQLNALRNTYYGFDVVAIITDCESRTQAVIIFSYKDSVRYDD